MKKMLSVFLAITTVFAIDTLSAMQSPTSSEQKSSQSTSSDSAASSVEWFDPNPSLGVEYAIESGGDEIKDDNVQWAESEHAEYWYRMDAMLFDSLHTIFGKEHVMAGLQTFPEHKQSLEMVMKLLELYGKKVNPEAAERILWLAEAIASEKLPLRPEPQSISFDDFCWVQK